MKNWFLQNIPKICHFYWGNEKMAFFRFMSLYSFSKLNPDWKIKLYVPKILCKQSNSTVKFLGDKQKDYFSYLSKIKNIEIIERDFYELNDMSESHKSDLLRWELLGSVGGVWSDTDILFTKSMNDLKENSIDNFDKTLGFVVYNITTIVPIGFLFSSPNNNFYTETYKTAKTILNSQFGKMEMDYQNIGTKIIPASYDFIQSKYNQKILLMSQDTVYKYPWTAIKKLFYENRSEEFTKESREIGIHWYGGSEHSQDFALNATLENYMNYNNTFSYLIKGLLDDKPL